MNRPDSFDLAMDVLIDDVSKDIVEYIEHLENRINELEKEIDVKLGAQVKYEQVTKVIPVARAMLDES